ncbi:MAG: phosphoribosylglycinamide formyltransferase [Candidatus Omnitrophica bacterium]|nr:phosphoribosylglycinamide formyltransferase [Candidatus Omnitrophota bacterium]
MKFAVFVSGNGSNLQAIIEAVKSGEIKAELALVFSDRRKAYALKRAKEAGIPTLCLLRKDYATPQSYERDIIIQLKEMDIDFIVLAGFMKVFTPFFIKKYPNQILNVHPSLLPSFKGARGIKDTFTYGVKVTGVTIHFADDKMDHGPIIMQESFRIAERETLESLEERVHQVERKIYPKAIAMFVEKRLKVSGRRVKILEKPVKK